MPARTSPASSPLWTAADVLPSGHAHATGTDLAGAAPVGELTPHSSLGVFLLTAARGQARLPDLPMSVRLVVLVLGAMSVTS